MTVQTGLNVFWVAQLKNRFVVFIVSQHFGLGKEANIFLSVKLMTQNLNLLTWHQIVVLSYNSGFQVQNIPNLFEVEVVKKL